MKKENLKSLYQPSMIDKALSYKVNFDNGEFQWTN